MNRVDRLFAIILLLHNHSRLRAEDLAATFEVSRRTIYRDLHALSEIGVPIVSLPGEGFELMEGFYLPPVLFTLEEARALFFAGRMFAGRATGDLPKSTQQAVEKIRAVLPETTRLQAEELVDTFQFGQPQTEFDLDHPYLFTIQEAITHNQVIFIQYHSYSSNEITQREVEPHRLYYLDHGWFFHGYCRLRHGARFFRLDRIIELQGREEIFQPRDLEPVVRQMLDIEIVFSHDIVRWVREKQHYSLQREVIEPEGVTMTYRVPADDVLEIIPWILSWGSKANVLKPPHIRDQIRQEAQKLVEKLT